MNRNKTLQLASAGMIAALYVVLTWIANLLGLASGAIQVRLSEALTILPVFTVAAVPGLTVGCVLANLLTGCAAWDVVFGSLATLIGAMGTRLLKDKPLLAWIPPVVSNAVIVPIVLMKVYGVEDVTVFGQTFGGNSVCLMLVVTVGIGEIIACGILGLLLWRSLKNFPQIRNMK
ncbi:MAG: QueT transporter family protein [Clostridia bacterium]|nr:QueT transporter family protein [Clostridia bacterium]